MLALSLPTNQSTASINTLQGMHTNENRVKLVKITREWNLSRRTSIDILPL